MGIILLVTLNYFINLIKEYKTETLALLIIFLIYRWIKKYYEEVAKYPKGPMPFPIFGNLLQIPIVDMPESFEYYKKIYGPVFTIFIPYPVVVLDDYESFKEALVKNSLIFSGRAKGYPESFVHPEPGRGIVFTDGDYWKEQRRVCIQIFRDFGMGRSIMESRIMDYVHETLHYVEDKRKEGLVEFTWIFRTCFANIMSELVFGVQRSIDDNQELKYFMEPLERLFQLGRSNFTMLYIYFKDYPWIISILKKINNVGRKDLDDAFEHIRNVIFEVKKSWVPGEKPTNFVHAYMEKTYPKSEYINEEEMPYVIHDLWVAGMETTATAVNWAMNILATFPEKQAKMREEIYNVIGRDRDIVNNDRSSLPYCNAAVLEILRFANTIPHNVTHRNIEEVSIMGKKIPKDTIIYAQQYNILKYDPLFVASDKFEPERFLMSDGKTTRRETADRMLAFSDGSHKCIGENMALMELFLFMTNLLSRYEIKVPKGSPMPLLKGKWAGIIKAPPYSFEVTVPKQ
uniref:Cytochrome P450 n=1 Tax=Parastrongyloides trichosuri TaxID=131310 RepID=A0A0N4ZAS7_PARTI